MTEAEKKKLYAALSAPFTDEAIERSDGRITGKGYSTTGIKYQYVVNRLNEVIGIGSWRTQQETKVREGANAKGRTVYDATCELTLQFGEWVDGVFKPWAEAHATGGHQSVNEADGKKGSYTNSLKKAAAMFGCGKQAYEGTLDDDNVPAEDSGFPGPGQLPQQQSPQQSRPEPQRMEQTRPVHQVQQTRPEPSPQSQQHEEQEASQQSQQTGNGNNASRNRLSSKQLAAIFAIARKLNYVQADFRKQVKSKYGVQIEFLDKTAASDLIGKLSALAANGGAHPAGDHVGQDAAA